MQRAAKNLSVSCRSPTLAAGVAAVGAQSRTLHRVRGAGRGSGAALREAQAPAIVLLTLHAMFKHARSATRDDDTHTDSCSYIGIRRQTFLARVQCSMAMRRACAVLKEEKR